jgi:hypothetical protein
LGPFALRQGEWERLQKVTATSWTCSQPRGFDINPAAFESVIAEVSGREFFRGLTCSVSSVQVELGIVFLLAAYKSPLFFFLGVADHGEQ